MTTTSQLEELLGSGPVTDVRRVFGGNARRAWAFATQGTDGIVLCQAERGQLESDPAAEFRVLRGLEGAGVRAPRPLAVDAEGAVLGGPSIALERLAGTAGIGAFLSPDDPAAAGRLTRDLARATAELHDADPAPTGLADPAGERTPREVALGQVAYWRALFEECRLEPHPILAAVYDWLAEHLPAPARLAVVHGDLRPGNVLYEGERITGLLDWEMAHLGDPAEDVAWIYRPLWSPERVLELGAFLEDYDAAAAVPADRRAVHVWRVFSEAKFATISLRAARVFHDGVSTNLRHADRAAMVTACLRGALELMADA